MNNKGQSGAIFIIVIPLVLLILAVIYDNVMQVVAQNRYKDVTNTIIKDVLENSYADKEQIVKDLYEKNKYETTQLDVKWENDVLTIYNVHVFPSFFGYVVGVKTYRTEVYVTAHKDNDKIIIEEVKEG